MHSFVCTKINIYTVIVEFFSKFLYKHNASLGKIWMSVIHVVTITAKNNTREYGNANPVFEYTIEGPALDGEPEVICEANATSPVGDYDIVIKQGSIKNTCLIFVNATLTITKAPLAVMSGTYTKKQGEDNPEFTLTYEGWKNNETEEVLTKKPVLTTSVTSSSEPGTFGIVVSGAEAQNYDISYVNGILTIVASQTGISQIMSAENGDVMIFTIDGRRVDNLKKGLNIIRMKDGTTRKVVVK